jgi:hypothetical protein
MVEPKQRDAISEDLPNHQDQIPAPTRLTPVLRTLMLAGLGVTAGTLTLGEPTITAACGGIYAACLIAATALRYKGMQKAHRYVRAVSNVPNTDTLLQLQALLLDWPSRDTECQTKILTLISADLESEEQQEVLLQISRKFLEFPFDRWPLVQAAAIETIHKLNDRSAVSRLKRLAWAPYYTYGNRQLVRDKARECLAHFDTIAALPEAVLLRAASGNEDRKSNLLRAASSVSDNTSELMRPVNGDQKQPGTQYNATTSVAEEEPVPLQRGG